MTQNRAPNALRGYGREHCRLRKQLAPVVALGAAVCVRCGGLIVPGDPWDLDHTDDRSGYNGPAHIGCNRGKRPAGSRPARTSREW